jgi:hypothetical protein
VRQGALDVEAMFVKDDSSEQVAGKRSEIEGEMAAAREYLNCEAEPNGGCECHYNGHDDLAIKDGASASNEWWRMISSTTSPAEKREIARALRAYCGRESYAMYAIWRVLQQVAA